MKNFLALIALVTCTALATPEAQVLWPATPPGPPPADPKAERHITPGDNLVAGQPISLVRHVSIPTFTVHKPDPAKDTGAAVIVFPGGGYYVLAIDLEGTEVCAWLNSLGITAILVEYRVPRIEGQPPHRRALVDGQRAVRLARSRAQEWGIDPQRIGVLGFSAGGNLAALVANTHEHPAYEPVDAADQASARPDFCILIYPAYLVDPEDKRTVRSEFALSATRTPPTFIAMTQDDNVGVHNAVAYYAALSQQGVPAELHVYPHGGHGYGLRPVADRPVTTWNHRVADWLKATGWLTPRTKG